MSRKSIPTSHEIVASLRRSSIPTILVEGSHDAFIYRYIQDSLKDFIVGIQPCGGRTALFEIYKRKSEFSHLKTAFVADQDAYKFDGIPEILSSGIIFTSGYSIENDLFAGSDLTSLLEASDFEEYENLRVLIGDWFASAIQDYTAKEEIVTPLVDVHINKIVPLKSNEYCPNYIATLNSFPPTEYYKSLINADYDLNVRGKQLFQMLIRFLSSKDRYSKYSYNNLIEMSFKLSTNIYLNKICESILKSILPSNN